MDEDEQCDIIHWSDPRAAAAVSMEEASSRAREYSLFLVLDT